MSAPILPRYPIYVPSKGRAEYAFTAKFLMASGVPFYMVVEEQERDLYIDTVGEKHVLVLPFRDRGLMHARNWIKDHATEGGHERHWQLDDNIRHLLRWYRGKRIRCKAGVALAVTEDFVDRYENVAVAGLNYKMFAVQARQPPFLLNVHVYSCTLVLNSLPYRWRLAYNDDTDYCLQVLAGGWCTILMNAFLAEKIWTMTVPGGNTDDAAGPINYQGDGRLKMARSLERKWPGVVETKRRYGRSQHVIHSSWRKFDTPLRRKPGLRIDPAPNEYGMVLRQVAPEIRSPEIQRMLDEAQAEEKAR